MRAHSSGINTMKIFFHILIFLLVVQVLPASNSLAESKLLDFEKEATGHQDPRRHDHNQPENDRCEEEDGLAEALSADCWFSLFAVGAYGGTSSWEKAAAKSKGQSLIPFVRLDLSYQDIESDVEAWNVALEAGYGPWAAWLQSTDYEEDNPRSSLKLSYIQALYRMSFGTAVEIDLGIGGTYLDGTDHSAGVGFSIPIKVYPWERLGFEFRPVWSNINGNTIDDYSVDIVGGWESVSLKAGYRWVSTGPASLEGPSVGVVFTY